MGGGCGLTGRKGPRSTVKQPSVFDFEGFSPAQICTTTAWPQLGSSEDARENTGEVVTYTPLAGEVLEHLQLARWLNDGSENDEIVAGRSRQINANPEAGRAKDRYRTTTRIQGPWADLGN